MSQEMVMGVVRTLLAAVGGVLVGKGWMDDATMQAMVGAIVTLGTGAWSIAAKKK